MASGAPWCLFSMTHTFIKREKVVRRGEEADRIRGFPTGVSTAPARGGDLELRVPQGARGHLGTSLPPFHPTVVASPPPEPGSRSGITCFGQWTALSQGAGCPPLATPSCLSFSQPEPLPQGSKAAAISPRDCSGNHPGLPH